MELEFTAEQEELRDAVRAVLVTIPEHATFKYVVMPMRI